MGKTQLEAPMVTPAALLMGTPPRKLRATEVVTGVGAMALRREGAWTCMRR